MTEKQAGKIVREHVTSTRGTKRAKARKNLTNREVLMHLLRIEKFLNIVSHLYPNDQLAPGFVCAYLPEKDCFYVSCVRYEKGSLGTTMNKDVLITATGPSLIDAQIALIDKWSETTGILIEVR